LVGKLVNKTPWFEMTIRCNHVTGKELPKSVRRR